MIQNKLLKGISATIAFKEPQNERGGHLPKKKRTGLEMLTSLKAMIPDNLKESFINNGFVSVPQHLEDS